MKAMILAAGLGTRLRPWTLSHPKALVPVEGVPMLRRVIESLSAQGFNSLVVNTHHFSDQIIDYLNENSFFSAEISVSDESEELLDTGGGILNAKKLIDNEPVLVHNVDILSTADLKELYNFHVSNGNDISLLVSDRESSRKLIFDENSQLCGWHNLKENIFRNIRKVDNGKEYAFSGIYILSPKALDALDEYSQRIGKKAFPIMDFFLSRQPDLKIVGYVDNTLKVLDIGKPASLASATEFLKR